ncbi:hypothetical protein SKAU_G00066590 [Synaphobranchus kaupii]|uniref:Uncharacterized protein n=1 Tax=Synaphobranchus kaupii TaxID=118154 RepID=A0A9Q1J943_SYNKA|nr:hypothetical protein SKAU_G00066590 [Synaphobranchus kaupii]
MPRGDWETRDGSLGSSVQRADALSERRRVPQQPALPVPPQPSPDCCARSPGARARPGAVEAPAPARPPSPPPPGLLLLLLLPLAPALLRAACWPTAL